jgi:Fe-S oxidoreductase
MLARSKNFVSAVLFQLADNMARTGDPLGFKSVYWTDWARGLDLPLGGETILYTGRMYQMLPYASMTTGLVEQARPLLSRKGLSQLVSLGSRLAGEALVRLKAGGAGHIRAKGEKALKGIAAALSKLGHKVGYLYEKEPYSGVLLHDLGLEEFLLPHLKLVMRTFQDHGIKQVICVDPHTTYMLRQIYPQYLPGYDLAVKHYLEIIAPQKEALTQAAKATPPRDFVIHDPCVMARNLEMVEPAREVARALGLSLREPENNKKDTACCGGPIEYAFGEMAGKICAIRLKELAALSPNILVSCPICLLNMASYENQLGLRVWDLGEVLYASLRETR